MAKIYILGHFGGFNTGDEAMLAGYLSTIPTDHEVLIKYKNEVNINWGPNIKLFHGSYKDFVAPITAADTLVLCGGTHFHDDYRFKRLLRHWLYLSRIIYLFNIAKSKNAKRLCIGNGFGPINNFITKRQTRIFCNLCQVITVRDKSSDKALRDLGITPTLLHKDLATLLNKGGVKTPAPQKTIGISLTSVVVQKDGYIDDTQLVTAIHEQLVAFNASWPGYLFKLFVIRSGTRESDHDVTNALNGLLVASGLRTEVYEFNNNLDELMAEMKTCNIFLASRFHSAVLATVVGCKLIILSYHRKLISYAEEVALSNQYVFDLQNKDILTHIKSLGTGMGQLCQTTDVNYQLSSAEAEELKARLSGML